MNMSKLFIASVLSFALLGCGDSSESTGPEQSKPTSVNWTLDIGTGRESATGIADETYLRGSTSGTISGRINGYDTTKFMDSLEIYCNVGGKQVNIALSDSGTFSFSASDFPIRESGTYFVLRPFAKRGFKVDPFAIRVFIEAW